MTNEEMVKLCESFAACMRGIGWYGLGREFDQAAVEFREGRRGPGFDRYRRAKAEIDERQAWGKVSEYFNGGVDGGDAA
ncbi:MAG TPA: hypothetical protein PKZ35_15990 [Gammaproteobacteria bacterium]|nr:hypothetical protein [Gammaproteobacteria bacterium]